MVKLKKYLVICGLVLVIFSLSGCGKDKVVSDATTEDLEQQPHKEPEKTPIVIDAPDEEEVVVAEEPEYVNLLTGLDDLTPEAIGKRPIAIMVNNVKAALPQYGVGEADVIFEIPVEGNNTRFMALYADYTTVPKVCSIRSCRYYFPALSEGFDAFYVSWGMDNSVSDYIDSLHLAYFNGLYNTGGLFGRDKDRKEKGYALEHTGTFDGTKLVETIEKLDMRTDLEEDKTKKAFLFTEWDNFVEPDGVSCAKASIDFGAQKAQLIYDAEKGMYFKNHNNNPQIDGRSGEQLAFTNVFVLETKIKSRDSVDHKSVDWKGGENAKGYYISKGKVQEIRWSKSSEESYLKFHTLAGEELEINRGKSYIAFNYANQTTFE